MLQAVSGLVRQGSDSSGSRGEGSHSLGHSSSLFQDSFTSRTLGQSAGQGQGITAALEVAAFELQANDAFLVRNRFTMVPGLCAYPKLVVAAGGHARGRT